MLKSLSRPVANLLQPLKYKFTQQYLASIDQSTTSTKFSLFLNDGSLLEKEVIEHQQITPKEGWL
jgi:glycerol kinase